MNRYDTEAAQVENMRANSLASICKAFMFVGLGVAGLAFAWSVL